MGIKRDDGISQLQTPLLNRQILSGDLKLPNVANSPRSTLKMQNALL